MNIVEVVRVRFRWPGKMFEFRNPLNLPLKRGQSVVVQTDEGDELIGTVMIAPRLRLSRREDEVLPTVLRLAQDRELDMANVADDYKLEIKNFFDTRMRSREISGVKLVDVEKANGGQKLILYFASEQKRFNYRELAVEMAQRFKVRVDMRPVGIRDAARLSGGIGKCGLSLCCSTWLPDFQQISIRMAKDQGLSLDPESINGQCGRLLCCLGYEHQNYMELGQGLPKVGKAVLTPKGDARVVKLDILAGNITVRFEDGAYETYKSNEVRRKFGPGGQVNDNTGGDEDSDDPIEAVEDTQSSERESPLPIDEIRAQRAQENAESGRAQNSAAYQNRDRPRSREQGRDQYQGQRNRETRSERDSGRERNQDNRSFQPNQDQRNERGEGGNRNRDGGGGGRHRRRNRGGGDRRPQGQNQEGPSQQGRGPRNDQGKRNNS